jgi:hypothetical protein
MGRGYLLLTLTNFLRILNELPLLLKLQDQLIILNDHVVQLSRWVSLRGLKSRPFYLRTFDPWSHWLVVGTADLIRGIFLCIWERFKIYSWPFRFSIPIFQSGFLIVKGAERIFLFAIQIVHLWMVEAASERVRVPLKELDGVISLV